MLSLREFILYFLIRILRREKIPHHIAFIPDNNRTYAKRIKIDLLSAYLKSAAVFYKLLKLCVNLKTSNISVYLLSTHNLNRNEYEKQCIFDAVYVLLQKLSIQPLNCRIKIIGDVTVLSDELQELCTLLSNRTRDNDGIVLNIALNYSGKEELIHVTREILHQLDQSKLNLCQVDENLFDDLVYTKPSSDVDLVIRTSTDKRLSEFLLWQNTRSIFKFFDICWPEITEWHFLWAVFLHQNRAKFLAKLILP